MISNSGNAATSSKASAQLHQASAQLKKSLRHLTTSQRLSKINKQSLAKNLSYMLNEHNPRPDSALQQEFTKIIKTALKQ
jgi:hypothetical protein